MDKFDAIIDDLKNNRQPKIQNPRFCTMDYGYQPTANFPEIPAAPTTGSNAVKPEKRTKESAVKNNDFEICSCYQIRKERHYLSDFERGVRVGQGKENILAEDRIVAYCAGTQECEPCKCKGNRCKCDFYGDVREEALKEYAKAQKAESQRALTNKERKELEFYRLWLVEHDLQYAVMSDFEKSEKEKIK